MHSHSLSEILVGDPWGEGASLRREERVVDLFENEVRRGVRGPWVPCAAGGKVSAGHPPHWSSAHGANARRVAEIMPLLDRPTGDGTKEPPKVSHPYHQSSNRFGGTATC